MTKEACQYFWEGGERVHNDIETWKSWVIHFIKSCTMTPSSLFPTPPQCFLQCPGRASKDACRLKAWSHPLMGPPPSCCPQEKDLEASCGKELVWQSSFSLRFLSPHGGDQLYSLFVFYCKNIHNLPPRKSNTALHVGEAAWFKTPQSGARRIDS